MKKGTLRILLNAVIAVMVFTVWILSFFLWQKGTLSATGWDNLRFFTVESNLLVGVVALVWLVCRLCGKQDAKWLSVVKYVSTAAVFVTFTVVVLFLGPLYGFGRMYTGANLYFHLIVPLLSIAEYVFFERGRVSFRETFFAIAPPAVYGVGYVMNCVINGIGEWPDRNDWYSFLEWGYGVGVLVFIVICAVAWGLGLSLRALQGAAMKERRKE